MQRLPLAVALVVLVAATSSCGDDELSSPATTRAPADAGVAFASAFDVHASGCGPRPQRGAGAIIMGGLILTAAHVVAGADRITVRPARPLGAPAVPATLLALDPADDLALLAAPSPAAPALPIGSAAAGGAGVAIVFRDDVPVAQPFTITKSVVVRILDIYQRETVARPGFVVGIDIAAGDSGAVLVGPDGRAVGVIYANSREAEHRAFATDTSPVAALVDAAGDADPVKGIEGTSCPL